MEIVKNQNGQLLEMDIIGRVDTTTAPQLEEEINTALPDVNEIILNFGKLEYISSAGLRIMLLTQKAMNKKNGKLIIKNMLDEVREVFEITGFVDIMTIE